MRVSLVMACYNVGEDILRVLHALDAQDYPHPFEVIVVDDLSEDDTFRIVQSYTPSGYKLKFFRLTHKGGPGAARNLALKAVEGELVIFIGDDTVPTSSFIRSHVENHQRRADPKLAVLGRIDWPHDMPLNTLMQHIMGVGAQQFSYYYFKPGEEYDYRHFYTANVSIRKSFLDKERSGFSESLFPFDDVDLAYRLTKHGLRIIYCPEPLVLHYHQHSIWTFSKRQWNAGASCLKLVRRHPKTFSKVTRPLHWLRKLLQGIAVIHATGYPADAELYELAVLRLASFYEWYPLPFLDQLYLHLLDYFYVKGFIDGMMPSAKMRTFFHRALQASTLVPAVKQFINQAVANAVDLPSSLPLQL